MKKVLALSLLAIFSGVFAYSNDDVKVANILAKYDLIQNNSQDPKKYGLDNNILRQEIVAIALERKGVQLPENYTCKNYFSDIPNTPDNAWVCRAMEIAADNGVITKSNSRARPKDYVTLSEALGMFLSSGNIKSEPDEGDEELHWGFMPTGLEIWQKNVGTTGLSYQMIHSQDTSIKNMNAPIKRAKAFQMLNTMNENCRYAIVGGYQKSYYFVYLENYGYYSRELKLEGADPKTFQVLQFGYSKDKNKVFLGESSYDEFDTGSFSPLSKMFVKDKNGVYIIVGGVTTIAGADKNSFSVFDEQSLYAKDKNHVYFYSKPIPTAESASFQVINRNLGKDKNAVFNGSEIAKTWPDETPFDASTFRALNHSSYTADKNGVYIYTNKISGADEKTFEVLPYNHNYTYRGEFDFYAKDKNYVYYGLFPIKDVETNDATTWIVLIGLITSSSDEPGCLIYKENGMWKGIYGFPGTQGHDEDFSFETKGSLFLDFSKVDQESFMLLPGNYYAKDKNHVYYLYGSQITVLEKADPNTFVTNAEKGWEGKDKNNIYKNGSIYYGD